MSSRCSDSDLNFDFSNGFEDSSVEINVEISNSVSPTPETETETENPKASHKACPRCKELILQQAKYCKHCSYFLVRS